MTSLVPVKIISSNDQLIQNIVDAALLSTEVQNKLTDIAESLDAACDVIQETPLRGYAIVQDGLITEVAFDWHRVDFKVLYAAPNTGCVDTVSFTQVGSQKEIVDKVFSTVIDD